MLVGIIYVIGVGVLRASLLRQALPENGPIKSKAPSLQFQNSLGSRVPTTSSMTPWLEMVSGKNVDEPRIFIVHNIINEAECEHLIALALKRGLQKSLITPYGSHNLVESSTRTNMQAWLEYAEDAVVIGIEERIAKITKTYPEQGENMQILHYDEGQQFTEHHDYFDPATDPPENYEKGGNRLLTMIMYLAAAEEGGETEFQELNRTVAIKKGDAVMFYNLKHGCDGVNPSCVDVKTRHAGLMPTKGEKWVATKWVHERSYQDSEGNQRGCFDKHPRCNEWSIRAVSECKVNPTWMRTHCNRSCKFCTPGVEDDGYLT